METLDPERRREEIVRPVMRAIDEKRGELLGATGSRFLPRLEDLVQGLPEIPEPPFLRDIRERADYRIDIVLKWVVCFVYSNVEDYIRSKLPNEDRKPSADLIERWTLIHDKVPLKEKMHELRIVRNCMIHTNGIVKDRNLRDFSDHGMDVKYNEGDEVEISTEIVEDYIDKAEEFVL